MSGKTVIRMDRRCATQERSLLQSIPRLGSVLASIVSMQNKRLAKGSRESRTGARPIHVLVRSGTGRRLGNKDDENEVQLHKTK